MFYVIGLNKWKKKKKEREGNDHDMLLELNLHFQ